MTAAFDNERDNEAFSSQETIQEPKRMVPIMVDSVPAFCRKCRTKYFTRDLTACPFCGSSSVVRRSRIHYAEPCEECDHDHRFPVSKRPNDADTVWFRIACQRESNEQTPRPANITTELRYVSCPRCLSEQEVLMDKDGRTENLGDM